MIIVNFQNVKKNINLEKAAVSAAKMTLKEVNGDVSIVFCDDHFIHELNKQYRDVDKPTDVLSFPSDEVDPENLSRYIGDVIISYPQVIVQSQENNHTIIEEVMLLVVHGTLHLLGYDHSTISEKKEMWEIQNDLLNSLGVTMERFSGDE